MASTVSGKEGVLRKVEALAAVAKSGASTAWGGGVSVRVRVRVRVWV